MPNKEFIVVRRTGEQVETLPDYFVTAMSQYVEDLAANNLETAQRKLSVTLREHGAPNDSFTFDTPGSRKLNIYDSAQTFMAEAHLGDTILIQDQPAFFIGCIKEPEAN